MVDVHNKDWEDKCYGQKDCWLTFFSGHGVNMNDLHLQTLLNWYFNSMLYTT